MSVQARGCLPSRPHQVKMIALVQVRKDFMGKEHMMLHFAFSTPSCIFVHLGKGSATSRFPSPSLQGQQTITRRA